MAEYISNRMTKFRKYMTLIYVIVSNFQSSIYYS
jgi:hypothetical protein